VIVGGRVLVTGGGGDIGQAAAVALAARGWRIVCADLDADGLHLTQQRVRDLGSEADAVQVDLSDAAACRGLVDQVWEEGGHVDAVVNCAGITRRGLIHEIPVESWDRLVAVNLSAVYWVCRAAIGRMLAERRPGSIVNLASIAGIRGLPGSPAYAATKGGVIALSRALAADHAADGIRVHALAPPAVDTRLYRAMYSESDDLETARREFERSQGAGRVLTVDEIARLILYLVEGRGPVYSPEPLVW
jgi:NAD(P)-dependent dehydrogenase (short-subunit alcohol dehydrogenase family)